MRRLRLTRTQLLLGLVVVVLATVPVLIPLLWTTADKAPGPDGVRLAASPGVPALPQAGAAVRTATAAPPPPAGRLASVRPTPSPTPSPTTPSPTPPPAPVPAPPPPAAATTTSPPATPEPADSPAVLAAGPDLVVVSVSWSPEPAAGTPVVFAAVVRNTGSEPTPAVTHGVGFSVDGTKVTWSANSSDPLGPGEERTYTADGGDAGNAWTATSGSHSVQAWADDLDRIPETNEDDNTITTTLTVP